MSDAVTVGLVDDDVLMLRLLSLQLLQRGIDVKWVACDGAEALNHLGREEKHPDVVVVDVRMPGMDGFELTRRMVASFGPLTVVMFTSMDDQQSLKSALQVGAVGYLVKTDPVERIITGVLAAASGFRPFSPALASTQAGCVAEVVPGPASPLTVRELEVLRFVAQSLTNDQIARRLGIAADTVKRHISAIMGKTGAVDRLGAVMWGVRAGLIRWTED